MKLKNSLVIFAKEPKIGKAKTRLQSSLSLNNVDQLYRAFIKDVLKNATQVKEVDRAIYYTGSRSPGPFLSQFKGFRFLRQSPGHLGQRMLAAFKREKGLGYERVVIVGTDCPDLTNKDILKAFEKLKSSDCVLGPSSDGGYYLIGLNHPQGFLFKGISWSTDKVLNQTLKKARHKNLRISLLVKKTDIDTPLVLKHRRPFLLKSSITPHTAKILSKIKF